jgi:hypothetical protein
MILLIRYDITGGQVTTATSGSILRVTQYPHCRIQALPPQAYHLPGRCEVAVVGGGPGGACAAHYLAREGGRRFSLSPFAHSGPPLTRVPARHAANAPTFDVSIFVAASAHSPG